MFLAFGSYIRVMSGGTTMRDQWSERIMPVWSFIIKSQANNIHFVYHEMEGSFDWKLLQCWVDVRKKSEPPYEGCSRVDGKTLSTFPSPSLTIHSRIFIRNGMVGRERILTACPAEALPTGRFLANVYFCTLPTLTPAEPWRLTLD